MPLDSLLTFIFASTILSLMPGPDNIFVLTQSALYGRKAGLYITLGLCTGLCVHTTAIALGLSAIFLISTTAFIILKSIGAAYLLYLAWLAFKKSSSLIMTDETENISHVLLYQRGIIMNISNPKVAIFFLAFLPQFTDPEAGSLSLQLLLLGFIFILITIVVFSLIAFLAGNISNWLRQSSSAVKTINRIAGLVYVGLALRLLSTSR